MLGTACWIHALGSSRKWVNMHGQERVQKDVGGAGNSGPAVLSAVHASVASLTAEWSMIDMNTDILDLV